MINIPAIAALSKEASIPAATARIPKRAISGRLLGANSPSPPKRMASELKFAKPQSAKLTTITVFGDNDAISGANAA